MQIARPRVAGRPRSFVRVAGPDAESFLQRMVSNDVVSLEPGESCDALLLTAKARVIAPLRIVRRRPDDFLLLTESELGERVRAELLRARFAAKAEIELERHEAHVVLGTVESEEGDGAIVLASGEYGVPAVEVIGPVPVGESVSDEELELLRIEAGTPRFGREIDDRVLPAEAGLVERNVSFAKGCYPGQEPVARLHYRGHPNRTLRVVDVEGDGLPAYDAELRREGKVVGRVTSAARTPSGSVVALAYVRVEVPDDAELSTEAGTARIRRPREV